MPYVLILLWLGLLVYCLIDVAQSDAARVRGPRKGAWIPIVLLVPYAGAILWLINGRPTGEARPARPTPPVRRRRSSGPDDDPEFLAALARSNRQRERERRRREQRDRPPDDPDDGPSA